MPQTQTIWNSDCKSCEIFKVDDGVDIIVSSVKPPVAFLSNRIVIGAQYYYERPDKHEYIIIFANRGNEEIQKEWENAQPSQDFAIVQILMSGYMLKPIYSDSSKKKIIGTKAFNVNQTDFGNIPNWIKKKVGPSAVADTWLKLATYAKTVKL